MDEREALRNQLVRVLAWEEAHVGFDAAVDGLPFELTGAKVEKLPYSIWQLVEHMRLAQRDILDFSIDPKYRAPKWPDDYWPADAAPPSVAAWDESLKQYRADRKALEAMIRADGFDPFAKVPNGNGQTFLREVLLVADHGAYHVGEIVAVRRLLGAWK